MQRGTEYQICMRFMFILLFFRKKSNTKPRKSSHHPTTLPTCENGVLRRACQVRATGVQVELRTGDILEVKCRTRGDRVTGRGERCALPVWNSEKT